MKKINNSKATYTEYTDDNGVKHRTYTVSVGNNISVKQAKENLKKEMTKYKEVI